MQVSGTSAGGIYSLIKIMILILWLARIFRDRENGAITITVMRWSSNFRLLSFIVEILNAEAIKLGSHSTPRCPAFLVQQMDNSLHVELPKKECEAFFEISKVRETLLIATRNEGPKPKNFVLIFDKLGYDVENLNDYQTYL